MQKLTKILIAFIFVFIIGIFYSSLDKDTTYNTENLVGKKINNIQLESFTGNKIYKKELLKKKKFTLINFWASWCSPCRSEHPYLMTLSKNKNLNIIGINFKDKNKSASNFLKELGNPYDFLAKDKFGKQSITFGIYGIPESILINRDAYIVKKFVGPLSQYDLDEIINILENL
tara:strand:- start:282 stop:803 length:522 start_codon:yes stop_codon:yes gene_type:complete